MENSISNGSSNLGFVGVRVDFFVRFTRFCLRSYTIRHLKKPASEEETLQSPQCLKSCFDTAIDMVDWILETDLKNRESLRFVSDCTCIMLALCILFSLQSLPILHSLVGPQQDTARIIDKVEEAGELIKATAFQSSHVSYAYGCYITECARTIRIRYEEDGFSRNTVLNQHEKETTSGPTINYYVDGFEGIDFSSFLDLDTLQSWDNILNTSALNNFLEMKEDDMSK